MNAITLRLKFAVYWLMTLRERQLYRLAQLMGCYVYDGWVGPCHRIFAVRTRPPQSRTFVTWHEFRDAR